VARLPVVYFLKLYESYREECDDHSALPLLLLHKYTGFLKRHVKFLNPFPSGAEAVITARKPPGLQRAGPRRV
jgi:hypothetical protein